MEEKFFAIALVGLDSDFTTDLLQEVNTKKEIKKSKNVLVINFILNKF
jgi:hypothetical protein